jgi:hypothetical protein
VDFEEARSVNGNPRILKEKDKLWEVGEYLGFRSGNRERILDKFEGYLVCSIQKDVEFTHVEFEWSEGVWMRRESNKRGPYL